MKPTKTALAARLPVLSGSCFITYPNTSLGCPVPKKAGYKWGWQLNLTYILLFLGNPSLPNNLGCV